jgi:peptidoglycan/LPS O-acetylase OafA/YrhL
MDTMGEADELHDDDDVPAARQPSVTTEALAVTSLTAAVTSLLVTGVSQYLIFLLGNALGLSNDGDRNQIALYIAPVAILSLVGVACGVVALKRRSDDRWVGALAFAGVALGGLILLLAATSLLITYTSDASIQG